MDCPGNNTIAELVGRLRDGSESAAGVEAHVADCDSCRRMMAALAGGTPSTAATVPGGGEPVRSPVPLGAGASIGRYRVLELLGAGGMGIVYAAHDPQLERAVALKLMLPELAEDPEAARELLLREAQAMAKLRHPNLVTVHDVGVDGERVYIAMELIAGQTLRGWLSKPRPAADVLRVMIAAGRGLAAAHDAGLVHRDFKPENVLCGAGGQVCVSDFGLARPAGGAARDIAGTPAYMAPEQRAGAAPDPRADQYSFCVVLGEAMERPPRWLAQVCARGRAEDPAARFPSMHALLAELVRDRGRARRRAALVVGGAIAVVLAGGGIALGAGARGGPPPCRGGASELAAVWNDARRAEVKRAIVATGVPFAVDTWERVERALDDHGRRWTAMHIEACEATAVHHSQSSELLDRRMACLAGKMADLDAAVSTLAGVDRESVAQALRVANGLPSLAACGDAATLTAMTPVRDDDAVVRVRAAVSRAAALERAGRLGEAVAAARAAAEDAATVGFEPLVAEAYLALAVAYDSSGEAGQARDTYQLAVRAAARSGHATVEARALAVLALLTMTSADGRVAREHVDHALAIVERMKSDPLLEATVQLAYARVLYGTAHQEGLGHLEAAARRLDEAARVLPAGELLEARLAYQEARGDLEFDNARALELYGEALATAEAGYGRAHPRLASILASMVDDAVELGDLERARGYARRVAEVLAPYPGHDAVLRGLEASLEEDLEKRLAMQEQVARDVERLSGPSSVRMAFALEAVATTLDQMGRSREALGVLDRVVTIWDASFEGRYEMLAIALMSKSALHAQLGEMAAAEADGERSLEMARRGQMRGFVVTLGELMMAQLRFQQGRYAEACGRFAQYEGDARQLLVEDDPQVAALDFFAAVCDWETGAASGRADAVRRARIARRWYGTLLEPDRSSVEMMDAWLKKRAGRRR